MRVSTTLTALDTPQCNPMPAAIFDSAIMVTRASCRDDQARECEPGVYGQSCSVVPCRLSRFRLLSCSILINDCVNLAVPGLDQRYHFLIVRLEVFVAKDPWRCGFEGGHVWHG